MSFSAQVKEELCRQNISRRCCAQAEAYGILLYCNTFHYGIICAEGQAARLVPKGVSAEF